MAGREPAAQFPPHVLREYAVIADGERGAVVGPRGDIGWLCVPRWDSEAVFTSLIGGLGIYAITPDDDFVWGGSYEFGTLIWRNRWTTTSGVVECREALAFPGDPDRAVLLRRVLAVDGDASVRVVLDPRAGADQQPMTDLGRQSGIWSARSGGLHLRWSGARAARRRAHGELGWTLRLQRGEQHDLVLEISRSRPPEELPDPGLSWERTEQTWDRAVPDLAQSIAPRDARHAYAVLRGLTSSGGGMVAAATRGLPERAEQGRNYDYRYVWIRDQAITGQAVAAAGPQPLLDDAVRFVSERLIEDGPELAPAYTIAGDRVPGQQTLQLPGYPGGHDIVGNQVHAQFQLDAFGEALLLFAAAADHDHLDVDGWRGVEAAVDAIARRRCEPEAGIWELDQRRWTESRLICAAGLRAIAAAGAPPSKTAAWLSLSERLVADTAAAATHPTGRWQRAPDDGGVDASLLLPPLRGVPAADDPRTAATLRAVTDELAEDHYLYRFRQQPGRLSKAEGAFMLCGFVMAMAHQQQGDRVEAARWFERNRAACGPAGLFSEEYDVEQRQLRGNLPQAFVHAVLLESSIRLAGETPE